MNCSCVVPLKLENCSSTSSSIVDNSVKYGNGYTCISLTITINRVIPTKSDKAGPLLLLKRSWPSQNKLLRARAASLAFDMVKGQETGIDQLPCHVSTAAGTCACFVISVPSNALRTLYKLPWRLLNMPGHLGSYGSCQRELASATAVP